MTKLLRSFINGKYVNPSSLPKYELVNPATASPVHFFHPADETQVNEAIQSSREAQRKWANEFGPAERATILRRAANILTEKADEIAKLETIDTGRPIAETSSVDVLSATDCINFYAGICPAVGGTCLDLPGGSWAYTKREPLGVTGGIGAWNYPLQSAAWKSAPALAFGNSMVFKPSEETPLTALVLAETYIEAGVPAGVFNVLLGAGETGALIAQHSDIAKVSFTGSVGTGRKVYTSAANGLKKVTMELGGKSPLIIFEDADLENAVSAAMIANWYSSGQVCSNGTRVFVHESLKEKFTQRLLERTLKLKIGDPMDPATDIGPMVNKAHMEKVLSYIQRGKEEGAKLLCGGERVNLLGEFGQGYYLNPAIFTNCTDEMTIVKEEIFGMVMSILSFKDEQEVLKRANDTEFGLSAGVFTKDIQRAHRMIAKLQAGTTWINNYNLAPVETPWGGYKKSGLGRENGMAGVESWTQLKSVYVEMGDVDCPYE